jgi:selenide,water dikinase
VTVTIDAGKVPLFHGVLAIAGQNRSGGLGSNYQHFASGVAVEPGLDADREALLYDPQTSGGLLIAVGGSAVDLVETALAAAGVTAVRIGRIGAARPGVQIVVRP